MSRALRLPSSAAYLAILVAACSRPLAPARPAPAARAAATTAAVSLWDHAALAVPDLDVPDAPVELGLRFRSEVDGTLGAIDFFRVTSATAATHRVTVWSASGAVLARATSDVETASGWQRVALDPPLAVHAGETYVASYLAADGHYGATHGGIPAAGLDAPPLHALPGAASDGTSQNGVYAYGGDGGFPVQSYASSSYWVDVELLPGEAAPAPSSSALTIWDHDLASSRPAIEVADTPVELGIRFRSDADGTIDAIDLYRPASATAATHRVSLWSAAGVLLAQATSSAETASGWQRVALAAPVAVTAGETYLASYFASDGRYGATGYGIPAAGVDRAPLHALPGTAADGTSLNGVYAYGADGGRPTQSFHATSYGVDVELTPKPAVVPGTSLWADAEDGGAEAADATPLELGVRWRSDVAGQVTALRFWKTAGNAGRHVGRLWDAQRRLLAQVAFTGETGTGWQTQALPVPVEVLPGETYVASYTAPAGRYAFTDGGLAAGRDRPPLHALAGGADAQGNGVFGAPGQFPDATYAGHAPSYGVDLRFVAHGVSLWPDTAVGGAGGADATPVEVGVRWAADVPGRVTALRFWKTPGNAGPHVGHLWSADGQLLASATFAAETEAGWQTQLLPTPVTVAAGVPYVASCAAPEGHVATTAQGLASGASSGPLRALAGLSGTPGALPAEASGNPNHWVDLVFEPGAPLAAPPARLGAGALTAPLALLLPPGAGGQAAYYPAILEAEGLGAAPAVPLTGATDLSGYAAALLPESTLAPEQVDVLTRFVEAGGLLVAMRPDDGLAPLLGLGARAGAVSEGYFQAAAGRWGITELPLQFHGDADLRPALPGVAVEARLFETASGPTAYPAVTVRSGIGPGAGTAVAFLFDVARSVVRTRQGNPALVGSRALASTEPANVAIRRSVELFYRSGSGPTYLDLTRFSIPQADELQRLLVNLLGRSPGAVLPLPRFWYLPGGRKAAVLLSGDDHGQAGTASTFQQLLGPVHSPTGCAVSDWTCARATSWIYAPAGLDRASLLDYRAQGFEIGPHLALDGGLCQEWSSYDELLAGFGASQAAFVAAFGGGVAAAETNRSHCFVFADWDSEPRAELALGIRLDENYTQWAPWTEDRIGYLNGSAIPMPFTAADGTVIPVYQVVSNFDYEYFSGANQTAAGFGASLDALLAAAAGPSGYYGVIGTHHDYTTPSAIEFQAILDTVAARNAAAASAADRVALVSAQQVLAWLDLRNAARFAVHGFDGGVLRFGVTVPAGPNPGLEAMLPAAAGGRVLTELRGPDGSLVPVKRTSLVKGTPYVFFDAVGGDGYLATYR